MCYLLPPELPRAAEGPLTLTLFAPAERKARMWGTGCVGLVFPLGKGGGGAKSLPPVSWTPMGASPRLAPLLCGGLNLGRQRASGGGGGCRSMPYMYISYIFGRFHGGGRGVNPLIPSTNFWRLDFSGIGG